MTPKEEGDVQKAKLFKHDKDLAESESTDAAELTFNNCCCIIGLTHNCEYATLNKNEERRCANYMRQIIIKTTKRMVNATASQNLPQQKSSIYSLTIDKLNSKETKR